ncbi:hypothetical protein OQA88_1550 [Cercophora sp. LCS_1]
MSGRMPPEPNNDQAGGLLRRLLPASSSPSKGSSSPGETAAPLEQRSPSPKSTPVSPDGLTGTIPQPAAARRKRQATTAACGAYRGSECEFDTNATETHTQALKRKFNELQSQKTTYEQIYEVLQTRPAHEAAQVLDRIRGGADINSILRYVNYGDVLVQLSVIPEAKYRYEFPYSTQMPSMLLRSDNPYLDSEIYEFALRAPPDVTKPLPSPVSSDVSSPSANPQHDAYTKPFHAAAIVHPLLDTVKPSNWTSVSTDDGLMRKLLHEYFLLEYDWFTFFHKDYFLQDMANERPRFFFTWQSLNCWYYFRPPLRRSPPEFPLPDPFENTEWYGETWVKYPLTSSRLPTYHPLLFKAKADLWAIINDYSLHAFGRTESHKPLPTSDVLWFYRRLLAWHDALPEPLTPRRIVFPHQIMLHMQYNHILIGILKPIRGQTWNDGPGSQGLETPYEAYTKAVVGFETVVRLYYLRHGFDAFDSFLVNFFGHLGHMALDVIESSPAHQDSEHSKSTILLAAKGLYDQSSSHYVAKVVLRLQLSLMRDDHIQLLRRYAKIEVDDEVSGPLKQPVQSDWPAYARAYDEDHQSLSNMLQALALEPDALSGL